MVLLAAEQHLTAPAIAAIVREHDQTVRNWLKRWMAEGLEGRKDRPMPGAPIKVTPCVYRAIAGDGAPPAPQPRPTIFPVDPAAAGRLYGRTNRPAPVD
jgi:hypothetical protein